MQALIVNDVVSRPRMQGPAPALSVCMSVRNGERHLAEAIKSILHQTFADFEFLVLDDGSTDASYRILSEFAARDPRIVLVHRSAQGLVRSLNELLTLARAPLVARIDTDDVCLPERFACQIAFLRDHPDVGLVGSNVEAIDESGKAIASLADDPIPLDHDAIVATFDRYSPIFHPSVMFRKSLVEQVGGFRQIFLHAEDYDLWMRLSRVTRLANLDIRLLRYRMGPEQVSARYAVPQARNAAIAWLCYLATCKGAPDPSLNWSDLPADSALDAALGPGSAAQVQRRIFEHTIHSTALLADEAWPALLEHARSRPRDWRMHRIAARLTKAGHPIKAIHLMAALVAGI